MSLTYLKHVKRMTELVVIVNKVDEIWEFDYKVLADSDPMMQKSNIKPPEQILLCCTTKAPQII